MTQTAGREGFAEFALAAQRAPIGTYYHGAQAILRAVARGTLDGEHTMRITGAPRRVLESLSAELGPSAADLAAGNGECDSVWDSERRLAANVAAGSFDQLWARAEIGARHVSRIFAFCDRLSTRWGGSE